MNMQWKPSSALSQQWMLLGIHRRLGTTTLEVLFAIAVVMIGLVGIASLIPYANRQAAESYVTTKAATATQNLFHEVQARRLTAPSEAYPWMIAEDQNVPTNPIYSQRFINFTKLRDVITHQRLIFSSATSEQDALKRVAFCYDPLFWAHQYRDGTSRFDLEVASPPPNSFLIPRPIDSEGPYRRTRFPYYINYYNPLSPLNAHGTWENQPRMIRITSPLNQTQSRYGLDFPANAANSTIPLRAAGARRLMSMSDDIVAAISSNDRSLPGARLFRYSSTIPARNNEGIPSSRTN